jgi:hypothetical protein
MTGNKEGKKKRNKRRTAAAVRTMTQVAKDDMLLQKTGFGGFFAPPDGNRDQKLQDDDFSDDDYDDLSEIEESSPSVKATRPEGMTCAGPSSPVSSVAQNLGWGSGNFIITPPDATIARELMAEAGMGTFAVEADTTSLADVYLQTIQPPPRAASTPTNPPTNRFISQFDAQLADATERNPEMVEDILMESAERQIAAADRQAAATEKLVQLQTEVSDKRQKVHDARLRIEERRLGLEERWVAMQERQAERSAMALERIAAAEERRAGAFEDVRDVMVSTPLR